MVVGEPGGRVGVLSPHTERVHTRDLAAVVSESGVGGLRARLPVGTDRGDGSRLLD